MSYPPVLPPEGWYPNPDNTEQQRWWDGHAWTEHVAVGAPMAPGATPDNPAPAGAWPGQQQQPAQPQHPQAPQQPQSTGYGQPYQPQSPYGQQQYTQPQYTQPQPTYPQYPGYPAYTGQAGYPGASSRGVLPDGTHVVGWWWRVLARLIDWLVLLIPGGLLGYRQLRTIGANVRDYYDQARDAAALGQPSPPLDVMNNGPYLRAWTSLIFIYAIVAIVYELFMLKYLSGTVGKLVCGLRVRAELFRGPLPWGMVVKRILGFQVAFAVPTVGFLYLIFFDFPWPLWDKKRQALHDKLADTVVVQHRDA